MSDVLSGLPALGTQGWTAPQEGPKVVPVPLPFTSMKTSFSLPLANLINTGQISSVQSAFIDNSASAKSLTVSVSNTNMNVVIPAGAQQWIALLAPNYSTITFTSLGAVTCSAQLVNYYVQPTQAGTGGSATGFNFDSNGNLLVSDTKVDNAIAANKLSSLIYGYGPGDVIVPARVANSAFCSKLTSGNNYINLVQGKPYFQLNSFDIFIDSDATISSGDDIVIMLLDNGNVTNTIWQGSYYFGSDSASTGAKQIVSKSDINYLTFNTSSNAYIEATISTALTSGNIYFNLYGCYTSVSQ
jgi:hypothetical protein